MLTLKIILLISFTLGLYSIVSCVCLNSALNDFESYYHWQHCKDNEHLLKACKEITSLKNKVKKLEKEIKEIKKGINANDNLHK